MDGWMMDGIEQISGFQTSFKPVSNYFLVAPHAFSFTDDSTPTVVDTQFRAYLQAGKVIHCLTPTYLYNICLYTHIYIYSKIFFNIFNNSMS